MLGVPTWLADKVNAVLGSAVEDKVTGSIARNLVQRLRIPRFGKAFEKKTIEGIPQPVSKGGIGGVGMLYALFISRFESVFEWVSFTYASFLTRSNTFGF